jgi:hypothetical protein
MTAGAESLSVTEKACRQTVAQEGSTVFSSLSSERILRLSWVLTSIEALWKRFSERIFKLFKWDFVVVPVAALNMSIEIKRAWCC